MKQLLILFRYDNNTVRQLDGHEPKCVSGAKENRNFKGKQKENVNLMGKCEFLKRIVAEHSKIVEGIAVIPPNGQAHPIHRNYCSITDSEMV